MGDCRERKACSETLERSAEWAYPGGLTRSQEPTGEPRRGAVEMVMVVTALLLPLLLLPLLHQAKTALLALI